MAMIKVCLMYQEELERQVDYDSDFDSDFGFEDDYDDFEDDEEKDSYVVALEGVEVEEGEEDEEDEEEDEEGPFDADPMCAEHFLHFKKYFTQAEGAAFIAGCEEGGAVANAIEAAADSMAEACEDDDDEDDYGLYDSDEDDDEEDDDDEDIPWKDEA